MKHGEQTASALPDLTDGPTVRFQTAIEYLVDCWAEASVDGIPADELAQATLLTAVAAMIRLHGDTRTAELFVDLPTRIRAGEFSIDKLLQ